MIITLATSDNQQQDNTTQEPIQSQEQPVVQNQQGLSETEIQNEINEKANTEEGAEVIRRLGEQLVWLFINLNLLVSVLLLFDFRR